MLAPASCISTKVEDKVLQTSRELDTGIKKSLTGVRRYRCHYVAATAWWRPEAKLTPKRK